TTMMQGRAAAAGVRLPTLAVILALALLAGCAGAPVSTVTTSTPPSPVGNATSGAANLTTPVGAPTIGERGALVTESFVLTPDHGLAVVGFDAKNAPATKVAEAAT